MKKTLPPSSTGSSKTPQKSGESGSKQVSAFLAKAKNLQRFSQGRSRLIFAIDATASRQPTWDLACSLQAEMFHAGAEVASLAVQLAYYRGLRELEFSPWQTDPATLADQMSQVFCAAGRTQIARLLREAIRRQGDQAARALVFIGDAMEENEAVLRDLAGQCRLLKLPLFVFQEGRDPVVGACFAALAEISGGAYAHFDQQSADRLKELLRAVARYAAGGRAALENKSSAEYALLLKQLEH